MTSISIKYKIEKIWGIYPSGFKFVQGLKGARGSSSFRLLYHYFHFESYNSTAMAYLSMGEAHRRITEYLNRFSDAVSYQNGVSFKSLFALSSNSHFLLSVADALALFNDANRLINQNDNYSQFSDIIVPLFRSLQHYKQSNFVETYNAFEKTAKYGFLIFLLNEFIWNWSDELTVAIFSAFVQEFRNWESAWALEALFVIVYEIRVLAEKVSTSLFLFWLRLKIENLHFLKHSK